MAKSATSLLLEFDGRSLSRAVKELSEAAERASQWLWIKRGQGSC